MNNETIETIETIEIRKNKVLTVYNTAQNTNDYGTLHALEALFGKELFRPKDVTERIKTFEDACRELGEEHQFVKAFRSIYTGTDSDIADVVAYHKLRIVCAALNEGWKPQFTEDEERYYPWHWLYTRKEIDKMDASELKERNMISTEGYQTEYAGFASAASAYAPSHSYTNVGSRLCLKSDALAVYCGTQFVNLWADFLLIKK